jgi:peptidase M23-like protein
MSFLLAALVLVAPLRGPVARPFDVGANPFAGGQHRGADLVAPPGTVVRAPCGGGVVVAGRVGSSGGVVTLACGRWRVTVMPVGGIAVRRGAVVRPRERLGTLVGSPAHRGLHLGVRREGVRFGYVDPLRFLAPPAAAPFVAPGRAPQPRALPPRAAAPQRFVPARATAPHAVPWPAFAGLALVLLGAGVRWHVHVRAAWRRRTATAAG